MERIREIYRSALDRRGALRSVHRLRVLQNLEELLVGELTPSGRAGPQTSPIGARRKNQPGAFTLWQNLRVESELDGPCALIIHFPFDARGIDEQTGPPIGRRPLRHGVALDRSSPIQESTLGCGSGRHIRSARLLKVAVDIDVATPGRRKTTRVHCLTSTVYRRSPISIQCYPQTPRVPVRLCRRAPILVRLGRGGVRDRASRVQSQYLRQPHVPSTFHLPRACAR